MSEDGPLIERNVPIPARCATLRRYKYPYESLQSVGDSWLDTTGSSQGRIAAAFQSWGTSRGRKFVTRVTPKGVRVWRTQ